MIGHHAAVFAGRVRRRILVGTGQRATTAAVDLDAAAHHDRLQGPAFRGGRE